MINVASHQGSPTSIAVATAPRVGVAAMSDEGHNSGKPSYDDQVRLNAEIGSLAAQAALAQRALIDDRMNRAHRQVLAYLLFSMGNGVEVAPDTAEIAVTINVAVKTAHNVLSDLQSWEYVVSTKRAGFGGRHAIAHYTPASASREYLQAQIQSYIDQLRGKPINRAVSDEPIDDLTTRHTVKSDRPDYPARREVRKLTTRYTVKSAPLNSGLTTLPVGKSASHAYKERAHACAQSRSSIQEPASIPADGSSGLDGKFIETGASGAEDAAPLRDATRRRLPSSKNQKNYSKVDDAAGREAPTLSTGSVVIFGDTRDALRVPMPGSVLALDDDDCPVTLDKETGMITGRYPSGKTIRLTAGQIAREAEAAGIRADRANEFAADIVRNWVTPDLARTSPDKCFHPRWILVSLREDFGRATATILTSNARLMAAKAEARSKIEALPSPDGVRRRFTGVPQSKAVQVPYKTLTVEAANTILDKADKMRGSPIVTPMDLEAIAPSAIEQHGSDERWMDIVAALTLRQAIKRVFGPAPKAPAELSIELATAFPGLDDPFYADAARMAFDKPELLGEKWNLRDGTRAVRLAEQLRAAMPRLVEKARADAAAIFERWVNEVDVYHEGPIALAMQVLRSPDGYDCAGRLEDFVAAVQGCSNFDDFIERIESVAEKARIRHLEYLQEIFAGVSRTARFGKPFSWPDGERPSPPCPKPDFNVVRLMPATKPVKRKPFGAA